MFYLKAFKDLYNTVAEAVSELLRDRAQSIKYVKVTADTRHNQKNVFDPKLEGARYQKADHRWDHSGGFPFQK